MEKSIMNKRCGECYLPKKQKNRNNAVKYAMWDYRPMWTIRFKRKL